MHTKNKLSITMHPPLLEKLKDFSEENGWSVSMVISLALKQYLPADEKEEAEKPPEKVKDERPPAWMICNACTASVAPGRTNCQKCGSEDLKSLW